MCIFQGGAKRQLLEKVQKTLTQQRYVEKGNQSNIAGKQHKKPSSASC